MAMTTCRLFLIAVIVIFAGCGGAYHNADKTDISLDIYAKNFTPELGKAAIYIVRPSKAGGMGMYLTPTVNKMAIGNLLSGSFLMLEVPPGKYAISAAGDLYDQETVDVIAEADKTYFVQLYPLFGSRTKIEQVGAADGRGLVSECIRYNAMEYAPPKELSPTDDAVTLYVIRPVGFYGAAIKLAPTVDNMVAGTLEIGSYLITKVSAGSHVLSAAGKYEGESTFEFEATKGQDVFLSIEKGMGMALGVLKMGKLSPDEGKRLVEKYKLIQ